MKNILLEIMQWYLLLCGLFCIIRIITGKTTSDKLTGLNVLSAAVLGFLVLHGVQLGRSLYLDVALVYDIFGFLGYLAIANVLKGKINKEGDS